MQRRRQRLALLLLLQLAAFAALLLVARGGVYTFDIGASDVLVAPDVVAGDLFASKISASSAFFVASSPNHEADPAGANNTGTTYVYMRHPNGTFALQQQFQPQQVANDRKWGTSVAVSDQFLAIGSETYQFFDDEEGTINAGGVFMYAFDNDTDTWTQTSTLKGLLPKQGYRFGSSVQIVKNLTVVGSPGDTTGGTNAGAGYMFVRSNALTEWIFRFKFQASDAAANMFFGQNAAACYVASQDAVIIAFSATGRASFTGAVYAWKYYRGLNLITSQVVLTASDAASGMSFGSALAVSESYIAVGAANSGSAGAVYVFQMFADTFVQIAKLTASNSVTGDAFGSSVFATGSFVVVGATQRTEPTTQSGAVYVYQRNAVTNNWDEVGMIRDASASASDGIGRSLAMSDTRLWIGTSAGVAGTARWIELPQCALCAAGKYCSPLIGPTVCSDCALGQFSNVTGRSHSGACIDCNKGQYTNVTAATVCINCRAGTYNEAFQSSLCLHCVAGTYSTVNASTTVGDCVSCPTGLYTDSTGVTACTQCPRGTYNPSVGATSPTFCSNCTAGSWSSEGLSVCTDCSLGFYATVTAATTFLVCKSCPAGTWTGAAARTVCDTCDRGTYSLGTATVCPLCPAGTFNPNLGSPTEVACHNCPVGQFANATGLSFCFLCPAATFANVTGGSSGDACSWCEPGFYSNRTGVSVCTACPLGRYSNATGALSNSTCLPCTNGTYAEVVGRSACSLCAAGKYQNLVGATSSGLCTPCPPGKYTPDAGMTSCLNCSLGSFSNSSGMSFCYYCPSGSHGTGQGDSTCQLCSHGTFSNVTGALNSSVCTNCSEGMYTTQRGMSFCWSCARGAFSNVTRATAASTCVTCPFGSYAQETAASVCISCSAGFSSPSTGATTSSACGSCPIGTYSLEGWSACINCVRGTYALASRSSTCDQCAAGSTSLVRSGLCTVPSISAVTPAFGRVYADYTVTINGTLIGDSDIYEVSLAGVPATILLQSTKHVVVQPASVASSRVGDLIVRSSWIGNTTLTNGWQYQDIEPGVIAHNQNITLLNVSMGSRLTFQQYNDVFLYRSGQTPSNSNGRFSVSALISYSAEYTGRKDWLVFSSYNNTYFTFSGVALPNAEPYAVYVNVSGCDNTSTCGVILMRVDVDYYRGAFSWTDPTLMTTRSASEADTTRRARDQFANGLCIVYLPSGLFETVDRSTMTIALEDGSALPSWLTFYNTSSLFFGYAPSSYFYTGGNVTIIVTGSSVTYGSFRLPIVIKANRPPTSTAAALEGHVIETGYQWSFQYNATLFDDPDGDDLQLYATSSLPDGALPSWLIFLPYNRTFLGTPDLVDIGAINIEIHASDGLLVQSVLFRLEVIEQIKLWLAPVMTASLALLGVVLCATLLIAIVVWVLRARLNPLRHDPTFRFGKIDPTESDAPVDETTMLRIDELVLSPDEMREQRRTRSAILRAERKARKAEERERKAAAAAMPGSARGRSGNNADNARLFMRMPTVAAMPVRVTDDDDDDDDDADVSRFDRTASDGPSSTTSSGRRMLVPPQP